jgi:hypothetical protein
LSKRLHGCDAACRIVIRKEIEQTADTQLRGATQRRRSRGSGFTNVSIWAGQRGL